MGTYSWSIPSGQNITGNTYIKDTDDKLGSIMSNLEDFVNGEGVHSGQGLTFDLVDKASTQTLTGIKTFTKAINANAGVVGDVTGNVTGNSGTATKLATPRTFNLLGDVTGSLSFDGSTDVNMTATIPDSVTESLIPSGIIVMFAGAVAPSGWHFCDGNNSTPDLRDKFIVGSGNTYNTGDTGGSANSVNVAHSHSGVTSTNGEHTHTTDGWSHSSYGGSSADWTRGPGAAKSDSGGRVHYPVNAAGNHSHSVTVYQSGESGVNKNLPPYYALAYIMKG